MAGGAKAYIAERIQVEDRGYSSPCWIWQLGLTPRGYAKAEIAGVKNVRVHRAAYELHVGPIPHGLTIDHLCRVKACCNPDHLEPVTAIENWRRALPLRRTHCACGAELTAERTVKGKGRCKPCWAAYMREWSRRRREAA